MSPDQANLDTNANPVPKRGTSNLEAPAAVALRTATETLCARRNPASVSVRHIAAEAGLSPGLVYHYYESREQLFGATLLAIARDMIETIETADSAAAMTRIVLDTMHERPAFARMVTALHLDGHDVTELMGEHPLVEELIASEGSDTQARVLAAAAVGILLSAGVYSDVLLDVVDAPAARDALKEAQANALASLFEDHPSDDERP